MFPLLLTTVYVNPFTFFLFQKISTLYESDHNSELEEVIIGPDGIPVTVKRTEQDDNVTNAEMEYLRQKMLKRAGSVDTLASVEDPNNIDQSKSKRRLNEHAVPQGKTGSSEERRSLEDFENDGVKEGEIALSVEHSKGKGRKANTILVKEQSGKDLNEDETNPRNKQLQRKTKVELFDDLTDSDLEKESDRDSGLDDDDEVDVTLNEEQQQMIVNMLFDEEMNLRPQFYRNENGQIVVSTRSRTRYSKSADIIQIVRLV